MRFKNRQKEIIAKTAKEILGEYKNLSFWSRVYDNKKGGDIDIFIETERKVFIKEKLKFLAKLELKGIERKVDLIIKSPNSIKKNIFETAKKEGIPLCWTM